jgi:sulfate adenylyltransferase (ADP) / ATP adenylyltransferase
MPQPPTLIEPGTLVELLDRTRIHALELGTLQPIATREIRVADGGVTFLVRQVDSLARKAAEGSRVAAAGAKGGGSPFLPPEPELTLGALSPTHVAVLNKFNVLDNHLLMVTRQLEHQERLLTLADMEVLAFCLRELDGLAFYNGGTLAGASQAHKHLQLVPLPLDTRGPPIPMGPLLQTGGEPGATGLPFAHAFAPLRGSDTAGGTDALRLHRLYLELLGLIGIRPVPGEGGLWQSGPYNLLVTRRWMLAVPRCAETVDTISLNALAFAGSLFVKDDAALAAVRRRGPMALLRAAAGAPVAAGAIHDSSADDRRYP